MALILLTTAILLLKVIAFESSAFVLRALRASADFMNMVSLGFLEPICVKGLSLKGLFLNFKLTFEFCNDLFW